MAISRETPYLNNNFIVDLGTGDPEGMLSGFTEVQLPRTCIEVVEYRNGNERRNVSRKLASNVYHENIILKRGCTGSLDLYEWWNLTRNGSSNIYRTVLIKLLNEDNSEVVMEWKLLNAFPVSYEFLPLNAQDDEVLIESIELAFERMEVE